MSISLRATDALLVIDMQLDFLPGGALAVADGDAILPGIHALAAQFDHVILTQDWHPRGHISFGAQLHPDLDIPHAELILRKGFRRSIDSYSAFTENDGDTPTGLAGYLRERGLTRLFFTGLAYDFCVGFSALAAARLGFESLVVEDLSRAVGLPGTVEKTNAGFAAAGVQRILTSDVT
jgi:nicotinamidase/pyrazinamidase